MEWDALSRFSGPQDSPGFRLWHDFMRWQRGLNAVLRPLGLTQPQFAVLATCGWLTRNRAAISQQDLVDFLKLDRMHISQVASRLEAEVLLTRVCAPNDRRSKLLGLSERGQTVLRTALPLVEDYDRGFFEAAIP